MLGAPGHGRTGRRSAVVFSLRCRLPCGLVVRMRFEPERCSRRAATDRLRPGRTELPACPDSPKADTLFGELKLHDMNAGLAALLRCSGQAGSSVLLNRSGDRPKCPVDRTSKFSMTPWLDEKCEWSSQTSEMKLQTRH